MPIPTRVLMQIFVSCLLVEALKQSLQLFFATLVVLVLVFFKNEHKRIKGRSSALLSRNNRVPNPRSKQNHRARTREQDKKSRRQHEPRHNRRATGQCGTQITIKRARLQALHTFLQDGLHRPIIPRQRIGTFVRAYHSRRGRRSDTLLTHRSSAIRAHRHCFRFMFETFHEIFVSESADTFSDRHAKSTSLLAVQFHR